MSIDKIDPNFKQEKLDQANAKRCYTIPCEKFDLYGVYFDENIRQFVRMDQDVAKNVSDGVSILSRNTSGGRLRFKTDSSVIGISVSYHQLEIMPHMPLTGSAGFALLEKLGNTYQTVSVFGPSADESTGYTREVRIDAEGIHEYILFFPLYHPVNELKIYLDASATVYEAEKYRDIAPILYYGASIDQGGCASRPDCSYTAMLSKWNNIDFVNLGFSGNCKGEPLMADYLTGIDCSLFFMAYDGNAPTVEYLEATHFAFYQRYRQVQKNVPVVFLSVPCFDKMPCAEQRRAVVYQSYVKARQQGDENVYFVDGEKMYGEKDRDICTVEGVHPNDLGFYRIAEQIQKLYGEIGLL